MKPAQERPSPEHVESRREKWRLFRRRQCVVPTWRGWLMIFLLVSGLVWLTVREVYSFLALMKPLHEGVLVVEGWAPDHVLEAAMEEFRSNRYEKLFVTGGPLEYGEPLAEYRTYADRGAAVLLKLGLTTNMVQAVPAPLVRQDRTYTSAVTLKKWWREHGATPAKLHLISVGP